MPRQVKVTRKKKGKLIRQLDEMWSFVGNKQKKQWLWLALDELTREIVGVYVGDSSAESAKKHGWRRAARSGIPYLLLLVNVRFVIPT